MTQTLEELVRKQVRDSALEEIADYVETQLRMNCGGQGNGFAKPLATGTSEAFRIAYAIRALKDKL